MEDESKPERRGVGCRWIGVLVKRNMGNGKPLQDGKRNYPGPSSEAWGKTVVPLEQRGEPGWHRDGDASFVTGPSGDLGLEGEGCNAGRPVRPSLTSRRGQAAAALGNIRGMAATLGANPSHPDRGTGSEAGSLGQRLRAENGKK